MVVTSRREQGLNMQDTLNASYPVLPLRDIVVFPHMIVPLFVGREKSVHALEEVMQDDKQILLSSQIDPGEDDPEIEGIYQTGVLANVLQLLKLPDGTVKVLVEGQARVKITSFIENELFFEAEAEYLSEMPGDPDAIEALVRTVGDEFARYAKVKKNVPEEAMSIVAETTEPAKLADLVSGHLGIEVENKQELLETLSVSERLEKVYGLMQGEMSVLKVERKIKTRVKTQMERTQREYYLNEQMKAIQKELGDGEDGQSEVSELEIKIAEIKTELEKEARVIAESQLFSQNNPNNTITLIAAASENNIIGKDNKLIWHLSDDLKHFKDLTKGHFVIMGRKTFESMPKALPNRTNVIITRKSDYKAENAIVVNSLEKALKVAEKDDQPFIIGGGEIYKLSIDIADRVELTRVHTSIEGDTSFPEINLEKWQEVKREKRLKDEKNEYDFSFLRYDKIK